MEPKFKLLGHKIKLKNVFKVSIDNVKSNNSILKLHATFLLIKKKILVTTIHAFFQIL